MADRQLSAVPDDDDDVDVGTRLREIRQRRELTLRHVADQAGVSESFLSQIERGRTNASVATLRRIAAALGVTIGDLFDAGFGQPQVLREADRPTLAFATLGRQQLLTQRPFSRFEVAICHLPPGGTTGDEPYTHGDSDELVLVVSGEVVVQTGEDEHHLHTGDCVQYRSSTPHRVANTGDTPAELVWVISPPSY